MSRTPHAVPPRWSFPLALVCAATAASGQPPPDGGGRKAPPEEVRTLLQLPKAATPIRTWMQASGWESQRGDPRRFVVSDGTLHLVSEDDSVIIGTDKGFPLDVREYGKIRFTIRIDENPRGMDLRKKAGEDAAFRLFVAFDEGKGFLRPPNSVTYTWCDEDWREKENDDPVVTSAHYKTVRFIRIGHGRTLGPKEKGKDGASTRAPRFVTIERDLVADYKRAFPRHRGPVPRLVGVALKCDSNNTGTRCSAWISRLELIRTPKPDPGR